ncbi:MAG: helix-turn-helix domain-containing protein, partial [Rubripirellula sp.]|nr:helix-turn-helix domain-containing protein [Rubripirellula sp.]
GRTPHEEITRLRMGKVKELLTGTELSLSEIASRTGFRHDEYLSVAFKKAVGVPPRDFRRSEKAC